MSNQDQSFMGFIAVLVFMACVWIGITQSGACSTPERAHRALYNSGFTDITAEGYVYFECKDELFSTHFEATGPKGNRVEGAVCCGFQTCTIRH